MEFDNDKKSIVEIKIFDDVLKSAETKWGMWSYKERMSELLTRELIKELEPNKNEFNYIKEFQGKLKKSIEDLKIFDPNLIYTFGFNSLNTVLSLDLPYSPEINIDISFTKSQFIIKYTGKQSSKAFRDYLSIALEEINGLHEIRRKHVSVAEVRVNINGTTESIDKDVNDIVSRLKQTLQCIYNALCEVYKKSTRKLFDF